MSRIADGNDYEDVFVFEDLVYGIERELGVVHVYMNRNNSLIKLHDVGYPCGCNDAVRFHSIIVKNDYIIQCCSRDKIVFILNRSGELLRTIPIADISKHQPILCQVDFDGNILIADSVTNRLLIAHADQPSSQWRVVNLPDLRYNDGCCEAVWFKHKLYVADLRGQLITFTPVDESSS